MSGERRKLNEVVHEVLTASIASGRIPPGTALRESDVARLFDVSRVPARSALAKLEQKGLLVPQEGRGYIVPGGDGAHGKKLSSAMLVIDSRQKDVLEQRNWRQRIFEQAELAIAASTLFGSFGISEIALAEYYGFNRSVARELLGRLERIGIAHQRTNGRWQIAQLDEKRLRDHYTMRRVLEPLALEEAGHRVSPMILRRKISRLESGLDSPDLANIRTAVEYERDLHVDIVLQSTNQPLVDAIKRSQLPLISTHISFLATQSVATVMETLNDHLSIFRALAAEDTPLACRLLRDHLKRSENTALSRYGALNMHDASAIPPYLTRIDP